MKHKWLKPSSKQLCCGDSASFRPEGQRTASIKYRGGYTANESSTGKTVEQPRKADEFNRSQSMRQGSASQG